MSLTKSQRARLGVFMIIGIGLLVLFAMIPVGFRLTNRTNSYYTNFRVGNSLSGLEQGADIKFRGVRIGKVGKISYNPDSLSVIRAEFRIQDNFPVKSDMHAETGLVGITGLRYVEIMGGSDSAAILDPGSEIPSRVSSLAQLTGKADVLVTKIELLLNNLAFMTHPDSIAGIKKIIDNVAVITGDAKTFVKEVSPEVKAVAQSSRATVDQVNLIAADVKELTGTLSQNLDAQRFTKILSTIDSTAQSFKMLSENLDLTIRQTREDFTVSMENLRETMENANELSKVLAENPSLILKSDPKRERVLQ